MSSTFLKFFQKVFWIVFKLFELFQSFAHLKQLCYLTTVFVVCQQLFSSFFESLLLNGEGGIWTLAPLLTTYSLSRGAPSAAWVLLQIAKCINHIKGTTVNQIFQTESVGFEPTVPFGITGFQDQLLKPLGQLSEQCFVILPLVLKYVKHFF